MLKAFTLKVLEILIMWQKIEVMHMISNKIWKTKEYNSQIVERIALENNLSDILATILFNRSLIEKEEIDIFLNPSINKLYNPFYLKDMEKAVERVLEAKTKEQKITVYGDYDVDGITSTSILYLFLKEIGCKVDYYIPNRALEGYGINKSAIKKIKDSKTDLIISVDAGITAIEECLYGKEIGIDIIITDHHECKDQLPEAIAVINPKRKDCNYPFDMLAGVGVAFKLIHGISIKLDREEIIWKYLELVAIGTISDLVPLINENRTIVKLAFNTISNSWNIGLKSLINAANIKTNKITAGMIGYQIGPRLNAAGRLGDAGRGVELFTTLDIDIANKIAYELNDENTTRQKLEQEILDEAINIIEKDNSYKNKKVFVIASKGWNQGVIGIVASRIVEKYYRPTIILTINEGIASGSARSVEGFNIFKALDGCKDILIKYGGHEMAAGMSLDEEKIMELSSRLNTYADNVMDEATLIEKIKVDYSLDINKVNIELIEQINQFEPYGIGNPEPSFILSGLTKNLKKIGQANNHIKFEIQNGSSNLTTLGFNFSHVYEKLNNNIPVEIIATLSINEWNQIKSAQLILKDLKVNKEYEKNIKNALDKLSDLKKLNVQEYSYAVPLREDFEYLYRYLLFLDRQKIDKIYFIKLLSNFSSDSNYSYKLMICLEVFKELKLINYNINNGMLEFKLFKGEKVELNMSKLYNKWTDKK